VSECGERRMERRRERERERKDGVEGRKERRECVRACMHACVCVPVFVPVFVPGCTICVCLLFFLYFLFVLHVYLFYILHFLCFVLCLHMASDVLSSLMHRTHGYTRFPPPSTPCVRAHTHPGLPTCSRPAARHQPTQTDTQKNKQTKTHTSTHTHMSGPGRQARDARLAAEEGEGQQPVPMHYVSDYRQRNSQKPPPSIVCTVNMSAH